MIFFPWCSAAAVASEDMDEAMKTPCCQLKASYTRGTPLGRRPPNSIALMGTPLGFSQSLSMIGQLLIGAQNLELGCAALVFPGFQFFSPSQVVTSASGSGKPSKQRH